MIWHKVIAGGNTHNCLTYQEVRLKEALYRALKQNYTIIYPDKTILKVRFTYNKAAIK